MGLGQSVGQRHARPVRARCQFAGCNARVIVDNRTPTVRRFCSYAHATEASKQRRSSRYRAITARLDVARGRVSILLNEEPSYGSLKRQFLSKWRNGANRVSVERIFMIETSKVVHHKYVDYGRGKNYERHRFHGTSCSSVCNFFFNVKGAPCTRRDCSVCSICTHGFQLRENNGRASRARNSKPRYGDGLYFSSMPSKANQYAVQSEKIKNGKNWRCMFAVTVVVGRAYRTKQAELPVNMCPPRGYDAVIGEVGPNLNHDEIVVYKDAAVIPTHLIVYSIS